MEEHAPELVRLLVWMILTIGGAFVAVILYTGRQLKSSIQEKLGDVVTEISAIKTAVNNTNTTLGAIERDLRSELTSLDRRITKVEARCSYEHGKDGRTGNG